MKDQTCKELRFNLTLHIDKFQKVDNWLDENNIIFFVHEFDVARVSGQVYVNFEISFDNCTDVVMFKTTWC